MKRLLLINVLFLLTPPSLFGGWTLQESGVSGILNDVCFVDSLHGWIAAGSEGNKGLMLRTANGGGNWEKVYTDTNEILFTIGFFDSLEGWAGGRDFRAGENMTFLARIFIHTTDGGKTWQNSKKDMDSHEIQFSSNYTSCFQYAWESTDDICIVDSTYGVYMINGTEVSSGDNGSWIKINYHMENCNTLMRE